MLKPAILPLNRSNSAKSRKASHIKDTLRQEKSRVKDETLKYLKARSCQDFPSITKRTNLLMRNEKPGHETDKKIHD